MLNRFLKENLALTVGIALPLALMALFFMAGRAAVMTTDPPQYDALFAVNYQESWTNQPWRIRLDEGQLVIRFDPNEGQDPRGFVKPVIHVWDHDALYASRVEIDLDNVVDGMVQDPELDALNRKRLLAGPESPDGYRFEYDARSGAGGLLGDLLGFARYSSAYALRKDARTVRVEGPQQFYQAHFIAWIEE